MDRRKFLRSGGISAATVVVAPIVVVEALAAPSTPLKGIIMAKARRKGISGMGQVVCYGTSGGNHIWCRTSEMEILFEQMRETEMIYMYDEQTKELIKGRGWNEQINATKEKYQFPEIRKES